MAFRVNIPSDFEEIHCSSSQIHAIPHNYNNKAYAEQGSSPIFFRDLDHPQQSISYLTQQTGAIEIQDDEDESYSQYSIEKIAFTPETISEYNSQCSTPQKSRVRSRKVCRICSKSVFDLRRHLEQCHKELDHLQVVKIVAESKRFRKDLKKNPTNAIRNVLLCPYTNEKGEVCDRPIVEYKLYQHLKFYHHVHPKSVEGIRLVKQARANPFAVKSVFPESNEHILDTTDESISSSSTTSNAMFDSDSDHYEVCISFPNETNVPNLHLHSDTNITQPQILTHSSSPPLVIPQFYSPQIQPQPSASPPPGISCRVVSICLNIAVSCNDIVQFDTQESTSVNIEETS